MFCKNAKIQSQEGIAYPKDEIQHKDHVFHAWADVCKVVAPPAIIHHRVWENSIDFTTWIISVLEAQTQSSTTGVALFYGDKTQPMLL